MFVVVKKEAQNVMDKIEKPEVFPSVFSTMNRYTVCRQQPVPCQTFLVL
jgi:hypothetical protein